MAGSKQWSTLYDLRVIVAVVVIHQLDIRTCTAEKNSEEQRNNKRLTTKTGTFTFKCTIPLRSTKSAQGRHSHATNCQH